FSSTPCSPSALYTLSLHDALPIYLLELAGLIEEQLRALSALRHQKLEARIRLVLAGHHPLGALDVPASVFGRGGQRPSHRVGKRSEEHTSELQSRGHLVCRLLLEK